MREQVEPVYIRRLPLLDAWGSTILYRSDGRSYRIVSRGADGLADGSYDGIVAGTVTDTFESDIVFGDGVFVQWPEGPQHSAAE